MTPDDHIKFDPGTLACRRHIMESADVLRAACRAMATGGSIIANQVLKKYGMNRAVKTKFVTSIQSGRMSMNLHNKVKHGRERGRVPRME